MSVGLEEAARRAGYRLEIPLAVDFDEKALSIYRLNFPSATTLVADVSTVFSEAVASPQAIAERQQARRVGSLDFLVGGPPCQGHSDLNNHTRRNDPKNGLYVRMARAAEVLRPKVVVIENVATVQRDRDSVVDKTSEAFRRIGYAVAGRVIDLRRLGVPQRRKRFVLLATRLANLDPSQVLADAVDSMNDHPDRTVRWAIGDLQSAPRRTIYDTPSVMSAQNARRVRILFEEGRYDLPDEHRPRCHSRGGHSYRSMYGRLRWTKPAQTITTGFGSMGQGRYIHPQRQRTLTPHEAARLQTFPDWFNFGEGTRRGVLSTAIGNAVPPFLMLEIGRLVIPALRSKFESPLGHRKRA